MRPSSATDSGQSSSASPERREQPEGAEATGGGAAPAAVRAAARPRPGQPRDRVAGRELDDADGGQPERVKGRGDVALDGDHLGAAVGAHGPRLDQLSHCQIDRVVVEPRAVTAGAGVDLDERSAGSGARGTRRRCRGRWRARTPAPTGRAGTAGRARSAARRRWRPRSSRPGAPARGRRTPPGARDRGTGRPPIHAWCWAITSVSGPIVNRPEPSSSTPAAHSGGASNASRYSASVAAGHSWRPVPTA